MKSHAERSLCITASCSATKPMPGNSSILKTAAVLPANIATRRRPVFKYVVEQFREQGWSLDACVGNAMLTGQFSRKEMVCTKTLYKYVDLRLLPIRNIDLPEKLRRNTKARKVRENRKNLGKSIFTHPFSQAIVKLSLYHSNSFLRWLCRLKNSTLASKASPRAGQTSIASAISASLSIGKRNFTIDE